MGRVRGDRPSESILGAHMFVAYFSKREGSVFRDNCNKWLGESVMKLKR